MAKVVASSARLTFQRSLQRYNTAFGKQRTGLSGATAPTNWGFQKKGDSLALLAVKPPIFVCKYD